MLISLSITISTSISICIYTSDSWSNIGSTCCIYLSIWVLSLSCSSTSTSSSSWSTSTISSSTTTSTYTSRDRYNIALSIGISVRISSSSCVISRCRRGTLTYRISINTSRISIRSCTHTLRITSSINSGWPIITGCLWICITIRITIGSWYTINSSSITRCVTTWSSYWPSSTLWCNTLCSWVSFTSSRTWVTSTSSCSCSWWLTYNRWCSNYLLSTWLS